jgi:hypothetical protein
MKDAISYMLNGLPLEHKERIAAGWGINPEGYPNPQNPGLKHMWLHHQLARRLDQYLAHYNEHPDRGVQRFFMRSSKFLWGVAWYDHIAEVWQCFETSGLAKGGRKSVGTGADLTRP